MNPVNFQIDVFMTYVRMDAHIWGFSDLDRVVLSESLWQFNIAATTTLIDTEVHYNVNGTKLPVR